VRRLWTNTAWKTAAIAGGKLLLLALLAVAARRLSLADFGYFSVVVALSHLLFQLIDAGVSTAVWREASSAADGGRRAIRSALGLRAGTVPLGALAAWAALSWIDAPPAALTMGWLVAAGVGVDSLTNLRQALFKAHEKLRDDALVLLGNRFVYVATGLTALLFGGGLVGLGAAYLLGQLAGYVLSWRSVLPSAGELAAEPTPRRLAALSWPLALVGAFTVVYFRIDALLLQKIAGAEASAYYGAAYRLLEAAMIAPAAFLAAWFPRLARAVENGDAGEPTLNAWVLLMRVAAAGVSFGLVFAPDVLALFFGARYAAAGAALRVLLIALLPIYANYLLTHVLIARRRQSYYARVVAICAAVNLAANLALIPLAGPVGAAVATVLTESALFVLAWRDLRAALPPFALQKTLVPLNYGAFLTAILLVLKRFSPAGALVCGSTAALLWAIAAWRDFNRRTTA
jgi:O-antigen/teichoic acid export membrane protein